MLPYVSSLPSLLDKDTISTLHGGEKINSRGKQEKSMSGYMYSCSYSEVLVITPKVRSARHHHTTIILVIVVKNSIYVTTWESILQGLNPGRDKLTSRTFVINRIKGSPT